MEAERKKVTNHSPLLTNYINTNYQSSLFGKRSEQFNCGGLTAVFLCSHQWHNCKSSEGETLPQAASGLQWIKKKYIFSFKGLEEWDSRVISTKAQIFDIFKPAAVYLWTQRYEHRYLRRWRDIHTGKKSTAHFNSEPKFAQSVNTLKPTAVYS